MTIKELKELLESFSEDTVIRAEGCQLCVHTIIDVKKVENEVWIVIEE